MTDPATPMIYYRDVSIAYGKVIVVHNMDMEVRAGQTFGLMGLNGAGKTTMIKALLGLRDYKGGEISINGRDRFDPDARQILAYLPERFDPPWFLKGAEFVKFSMDLYGRSFDRAELEALADRLDLERRALDRRVQTYSKGMRQKLGIMATLLTGCKILILDEPMSGLDPQARAAVKGVLKDVAKSGTTIFFSSHILADMDEICDEVAVMHRGRIAFTGTPKALKAEGQSESIERSFLNVINNMDMTSAAA